MIDGLRVLDFTTESAGPYCTKVLADAGADVVKWSRTKAIPSAGGDRGACSST